MFSSRPSGMTTSAAHPEATAGTATSASRRTGMGASRFVRRSAGKVKCRQGWKLRKGRKRRKAEASGPPEVGGEGARAR